MGKQLIAIAVATAAAVTTIQVAAQTRPGTAAAVKGSTTTKGSIPRTADGHPDLTGVYDLATPF